MYTSIAGRSKDYIFLLIFRMSSGVSKGSISLGVPGWIRIIVMKLEHRRSLFIKFQITDRATFDFQQQNQCIYRLFICAHTHLSIFFTFSQNRSIPLVNLVHIHIFSFHLCTYTFDVYMRMCTYIYTLQSAVTLFKNTVIPSQVGRSTLILQEF